MGEVTLDLNPLPYNVAFDIIEYCVDQELDTEHCYQLLEACHIVPVPDIKWEVTVPEQHASYIILKFASGL